MKNLIRNILKESDWDFMDDIDSRHPLLNLLEGVDYKMWVGNITDEERDTISSQLHTLFPNETKNIENNYKIFTAIYFDWNLGHHYLEFGTNNVDSNFKEESGTELSLDILLDNHMNESEDKEGITQTQLYTLIDKIDAFKEHTNYTDWYLNGGCYVFADAMLKLLPNSELIGIGDDYSDIAHVVVLWEGYYVDYNNVTNHKSDILLNLDMDAHGPIRWTKPTTYTIRGQHNYSESEVDKIISFFE